VLKKYFFGEKWLDIWRCNEAAPPDIQLIFFWEVVFQQSPPNHFDISLFTEYNQVSRVAMKTPNKYNIRILCGWMYISFFGE
jgi:hypothetical protein